MDGSERILLPVGDLPAARLRFDPTVWSAESVLPGLYQIGSTIEVVEIFERKILLRLPDEHILMERIGEPDLTLISSSIAAFVSSAAIYAFWYRRIVALEGHPDGAELYRMTAEAQAHLRLIEADTGSGLDPQWWLDSVAEIGRLI